MLVDLNELAQIFTDKLNALGKSKGFDYKIFGRPNEFLNTQTIQGVIVPIATDGSPIPGFSSRDYNFLISFDVLDNFKLGNRYEAFNNVINTFITQNQGINLDLPLTGGKGILTFDVLKPQKIAQEGGLGLTVLSSFGFKLVYSKNATTTSSAVWKLNGIDMPITSRRLSLDKSGATNSVFGLNATQSLPIKQTKTYRFTMPISNDNPICTMLTNDLLIGDLTKTYELSYYDGVTFTETAPFTTTVTLFGMSEVPGETPSVLNLEVSFQDASDETSANSGPIRYEMALIDNQFDDSSVNTRYFNDRTEQQAWFLAKIDLGAPYSIIKAPNLNNLTITQQVYLNNSNLDLNSLLTKNYAVIKAVDKATNNVLYYYYYFIKTANVGSGNQILVDLKMDTIQTYYFDPNIEFTDSVINRTQKNDDISLLTSEPEIGFEATIKTNRQNFLPSDFWPTAVGKEYLNAGWYYVYSTEELSSFNFGDYTRIKSSSSTDFVRSGLFVYAFPGILETPSDTTDITVEIDTVEYGLKKTPFLNQLNDRPEVISIKFSLSPPYRGIPEIDITRSGNTYTYTPNNFDVNTRSVVALPLKDNIDRAVFFIDKIDISIPQSKIINLQIPSEKKNTSPYKKYKLWFANDEFDINPGLLKNNPIKLNYYEDIKPGLTTSFLNLENTPYYDAKDIQQGVTSQYDASIPLRTEAFNNFWANNTNAAITGLAIPAATTVAGLALAPFTGGLSAAIAGGAAISSAGQVANFIANQGNLANSPSSVKFSQSGNILSDFVQKIIPAVLTFELKEYEKIILDNYFDLNGYNYGIKDSPKNYDNVDNTKSFLKAQIVQIDGISISNDARNDMKSRFNDGIRFYKD